MPPSFTAMKASREILHDKLRHEKPTTPVMRPILRSQFQAHNRSRPPRFIFHHRSTVPEDRKMKAIAEKKREEAPCKRKDVTNAMCQLLSGYKYVVFLA
ncbi:unnamed protein product [Vicia faba]|uniref:Uncharacterized protein n=1 Tax=Vicia faba TaxID=3906 RepID=A0AAV1B0R4_VICFA|nr:unnamed protein product [Vicia faba]